jgi:protein TonB
VIDAVDRVIAQREGLERGFNRSLWLSVVGHLVVVGAAVAAPLLMPNTPKLRVAHGTIVPVPPGGGGTPSAPEPAPGPDPAPPQPPQAAPKPPPRVKKPPKKAPEPEKKGVAPLESKKRSRRRSSTASKAAGTSSQSPGLSLELPPGPGAPGGTDHYGDWYLASVQRKIWLLWNRQIRTGPRLAVRVSFAILADGSVEDVRVVRSSGAYLLDQAAQRAVLSAAPFGPLPKHYGTKRYEIHAQFRPTP